MSKYTKEMSESEILMALANIRTELLNAVDTIEAIEKNSNTKAVIQNDKGRKRNNRSNKEYGI